jgi:hypothetical protein
MPSGTQTQAVVPWEPTGIEAIDRAVVQWRATDLLPVQFKDRDGRPKLADMALASSVLYALEVPPGPNLPAVYVIKGRVGLMARIQIPLAQRDGWDIEPVEESAEACAVRMRYRGGRWKPVIRVTMAQATQAGWTARSRNSPDVPSNYELMPERMLMARAVTKAIGLYAPGVLTGIRTTMQSVGSDLADEDEGPDSGPDAEGEPASGPEFRADGSTIPAHQRQPVCPEDLRQSLVERLVALEQRDPDAVAILRQQIAPARIPNFRSRPNTEFKLAHAWLIDRYFAELETALAPTAPESGASGGAGTSEGPAILASAPPGTSNDSMPASVIDNAPESRGMTAEDDPGRPFE